MDFKDLLTESVDLSAESVDLSAESVDSTMDSADVYCLSFYSVSCTSSLATLSLMGAITVMATSPKID